MSRARKEKPSRSRSLGSIAAALSRAVNVCSGPGERVLFPNNRWKSSLMVLPSRKVSQFPFATPTSEMHLGK